MYMYYKAGTGLYVMSAIAVIIFIMGAFFKIYRWKNKHNLHLSAKEGIAVILRVIFFHLLLQLHLLKRSFVQWVICILILWGFLGLLAQTSLLAFLSHFISPASPLFGFVYQGKGKILLDVWGDIWGTALLVGPIMAVVARYVLKKRELNSIAQDYFAILLLLAISVTGFLGEFIRVKETAASPTYIGLIRNHLTISLLFIAYIPFSRLCRTFVKPMEQLFLSS